MHRGTAAIRPDRTRAGARGRCLRHAPAGPVAPGGGGPLILIAPHPPVNAVGNGY